MAGLQRHFASTMPLDSIGASANARVGYTTSARNFRTRSLLSPAVRTQLPVELHNIASHGYMRTTQGRPSFRAAPLSKRQWGNTPRPRRSVNYPGQIRSQAVQSDVSQYMPQPVYSLVARLSLSSTLVELPEDQKSSMKTVDANTKTFKLRFSGASTEDWLDHVNELELQCARKHCWTARQFSML